MTESAMSSGYQWNNGTLEFDTQGLAALAPHMG